MKKSILLMFAGLLLAGTVQAAGGPVRIGAKVFTEQAVLSELTAQYLATKGYRPEIVGGLGSTIAWNGLKSGQLDITWEYTGTSLVAYNKITERLDPQATYERVKELDAKNNAIWLTPARLNNTYAMAISKEIAEEYPQIQSISDLAKVLESEPDKTHLFAMDIEFANRSDGLEGLNKQYGMSFTRNEIRSMDPGLVFTALKNGQVFCGMVNTTDGRLEAFGLKILEDDKSYFPDYTAAPVANKSYLEKNPEIAELLKPLAESLDDETIQGLNAKVDIERLSPAAVAAHYLRESGLIEGGR
ncbi:glycine betaine ABC transporter substrate-binding protein [Pseudomonas matsuisoli]|uniref:Glycine/betaine ABC transporter substrate-binding protein n=1 Tax=Pseudomonas matsuisoli TaxID=1515666 RepID=A0A917V1D9_9PSED|nr:glycine betaine ABC transporter substrate-binding protein [Pseudomonas matsuisoli]GGK08465.1 glycine/betaine ABC transporter substrate-binding protein [Pseudomonas matsuisoli]